MKSTNKLTFLIICSFFLNNSFNRYKSPIEGYAVYNQLIGGYQHEGTLLFESSKSLYFYGRSSDGKEKEGWKNDEDKMTYALEIKDKEGWSFYKNFTTRQMITRETIWDHFFLVEESIPKLSWELKDGIRIISKFKCQKAVTTFRGRNYEVWFSPEIPSQDGPWKLCGLPGLILEAASVDGEVKFTLKSLELGKVKNEIVPPKLGKKLTRAEYEKKFREKMNALIQSIKANMDPNGTGSADVKLSGTGIEKLTLEDDK
jgi:GLPGLI family protein